MSEKTVGLLTRESRLAEAPRAKTACISAPAGIDTRPVRRALERQGLVKAQWEISDRKQRTRVYRLTPGGRRHLAGERSRWEQLQAAIGGVLNRARTDEA